MLRPSPNIRHRYLKPHIIFTILRLQVHFNKPRSRLPKHTIHLNQNNIKVLCSLLGNLLNCHKRLRILLRGRERIVATTVFVSAGFVSCESRVIA